MPAADLCAIDFDTSNFAVEFCTPDGVRLAKLEAGFSTIPTAVFCNAEGESRCFGRAAVAAWFPKAQKVSGNRFSSVANGFGIDAMRHFSA